MPLPIRRRCEAVGYGECTTHRVLVLTGGPAAGKSTTALALATTTPRTAFIDVDDVRQLVKNGGAAPWDGEEGASQQLLGVRNATWLASNFVGQGINVTVADVVNPITLALYRELLPDVLVVRLTLGLEEARRRAAQRTVYLTDAEFEELHRQQGDNLQVDHELDVADMGIDEQVAAVMKIWTAG